MKRINILYATDENYAMYTGISLYSLLENNTSIDELVVYILDNSISFISKERIKNIANSFGRPIHFLDGKKLFEGLSQKVTMKNTQTITAYACCFLPYILNENIDEILYMDGDSLICGDLSELCNIDLSDTYACGVLDIAAPIVKEKINFKQNEPYINSGFLYMNLTNIRKANLQKKIEKFIEEIIPYSMHNDQDVINGVYKGHIKVLPPQYNLLTPLFEKKYADTLFYYNMAEYYTKTCVVQSLSKPLFIHFTASFSKRPWVKGCKHPLKKEWEKYKDKTEWRNEPTKEDTRSTKRKFIDKLYLNLNVHLFKFLFNLFGNK